MILKIPPYDGAEYLDTEEAVQEYLQATCEDGTPAEIAHSLGVIARARNMTELAKNAGLTRQALYEALSGEGNPELATVAKIAEALDLRITFVSKTASQDTA